MCGRFSLTASPRTVSDHFDLAEIDGFPARYNIAPTQPILVVTAADRPAPGSNLPPRRASLARWGFLPGWVKNPAEFPLLINARAETAAEKASFRGAMRHRRILIPASGFYEWRRPPKESGVKSQAYWITPGQGQVFAFGGLLETWASADGSEIDTAAILTTKANSTVAQVHDRMPIVISQRDYEAWLDCAGHEPRHVAELMKPVADDFFKALPVSDLVNKVSNMGPDLQKPVAVAEVSETAGKPKKRDAGQMSLF